MQYRTQCQDVLYDTNKPLLTGCQDYKKEWSSNELVILEEELVKVEVLPCAEWCYQQATAYMDGNGRRHPLSEEDALHLYLDLCDVIVHNNVQ